MALVYRVEPGYLTAMGIPLKHGRFFNDQDDERSQSVVVIDEVFARKHFGDADPVGKRILQEGQDAQQIIGVVGHVKQWSIDSDEEQTLQAQLYEPFRQFSNNSMNGLAAGLGVVTRYDGASPPFESIRHVVQSRNKQNVISRSQTMNDLIAETLADRRFSMILLDAFAVVALLLASLGLYGVISYLVGQRTHELGIRLALGAQRRDVLRLVLSHGMKMALAGVALGLVAALGLTRLLAKMLYGVSATDPATFTVIALLLTVVALLACFVPARRATKVDPLVALRYE
jgi:predicted permease